MGTVFSVDAVFADVTTERARRIVADACRILHEVDDTFSTWRANSPISRLRRGELALNEAPAEIAGVLDACATARDMSDGWFDPWAAPDGVDPTGYVKGWSGQRLLHALRERGAEGALVNAAGDVAAFGFPEASRHWRIGLVDPLTKDRLLGVVSVDDRAMAVSGTYERGDHIYDPHGGPATSGVVSAAVVGPDLGVSDALATALVAGGTAALEVIKMLPDHEGLLVFDDGGRCQTTEFPLEPVISEV